jgi:hypothetical protein
MRRYLLYRLSVQIGSLSASSEAYKSEPRGELCGASATTSGACAAAAASGADVPGNSGIKLFEKTVALASSTYPSSDLTIGQKIVLLYSAAKNNSRNSQSKHCGKRSRASYSARDIDGEDI